MNSNITNQPILTELPGDCKGINIWNTFKNLNTGKNNLKQRFKRFYNEKGYYLSNDAKDKCATITNIILIVLTIAIIIIMFAYNANIAFTLNSTNSYRQKIYKVQQLIEIYNKQNSNKEQQDEYQKQLYSLIDINNDNDIDKSTKLDNINQIYNTTEWKVIQLILSILVGTILVYNIYKRTTVSCNN